MSYIKKFIAMRLDEPVQPEPLNKMFSSLEDELKLISKGMADADRKLAVDAEATPGYLGALASDGVLRVNAPLTYADGGNFVTLDIDESQIDHALLGGVLADQHHPQAHTLASHSSKAHSELTGVTSDQHHPQSHTLASHSTKPHSALTGVTSDQHHAQLHETAHRSGGGDELNHDLLVGFVAGEHLVLPNTIASVLSDHDKAAHDALGLDHGALSGKGDDNHSQYHNNTRGDARYYTKTLLNAGQLDTRYYTEGEIDTLLLAMNEFKELTDTPANYTGHGLYAVRVKASEDGLEFAEFTTPGAHTHVKADITDTPWAWANVLKTGSNLTDLATRQHAGLTDISSDQHHAQLHASAHQADGGDPLNNLLLGASPYIKWQSGNLLIQTDEGVNTDTTLEVKGKGAGKTVLNLYDEDDAEKLVFYTTAGIGHIKVDGTSPQAFRLQHNVPVNILCWSAIASGNPSFYIYGYQTGVGVKYGRFCVDPDGIFVINTQLGGQIRSGAVLVATWDATRFGYRDGKVASFGNQADYAIGYHEPTDTLQIVDGMTLNANIRAKLAAGALWEFYNKVGIGITPSVALHVLGGTKLQADTDAAVAFQFQRHSATGRAQMGFYTEAPAQMWRVGMTGAGSSDFSFYDQTQNLLQLIPNDRVEVALNLKTPKLTIGSYYLNSLIANNKVPDSDKWNGHQMPALVTEKVLYNNGSALSWERLNFDWLSDVNIDAFITPYEACLLCYDQNGGQWVAGMPEYDIRFKSYQIMYEFWDGTPPSPWAYGTLNAGTITVTSGDDHPGACIVRTRSDGDATDSGYYWVAANNEISVGGLEQMDFVFSTPSSLTGRRWRLGFQDSLNTTAPVDGIYFEMSADTIIRGVCRDNNSQTVTGTTYTLSTSTWYRGRITVNAAATTVGFKIYSAAGTELWSQIILNNIPTGSARAVGFGLVAWINFDSNSQGVITIDLADLICARGLTR